MKLDTSSLAHTKWECKYHIVFAPKFRRQIIYGKIKMDIGQMLRKLCECKGIEMIEAEACKDHIHMLVSIPPKYSVAQIMGYSRHLYTGFAHIITTKASPPLMKYSTASPSTVADVMTRKYVYGVPLSQQEKIWARQGVERSKATLANWVIQGIQSYLKPLYKHIKQ